jgi:hypothetical protein
MSHGDTLYFLAREDVPTRESDCWRIKVDRDLGAVLGFGSIEAASEYARRCHVPLRVLRLDELAPEIVGTGALLVFRTVGEIEAAYVDAKSYDFRKHLEAWPKA